jgi:hypothetical protein
MSNTYTTFCKRCDAQTEHYESSGSCKPCTRERNKTYINTPKGRAKKREHCRNYMRRIYAARDLVRKLGLSVEV